MSTLIKKRCWNCAHYAQHKHPNKEDICKNLGVREYSEAPRCFNVSYMPLVRANVDIHALGKVIRHLQPSHMELLALTLSQSAELLEYGFKFGQKVFINLGIGNYLKNYFPAYVVAIRHTKVKDGYTKKFIEVPELVLSLTDTLMYSTEHDKRILMLTPIDTGRGASKTVHVYTVKEFKEIKEWCIKEDRVEIPEGEKQENKMTLAAFLSTKNRPIPVADPFDYTPPTIDEAPDPEDIDKFNAAHDNDAFTLVATDDIKELLTSNKKVKVSKKAKEVKLDDKVITKNDKGDFTISTTVKQKSINDSNTHTRTRMRDIEIRAF